jgi:hypothetical protein
MQTLFRRFGAAPPGGMRGGEAPGLVLQASFRWGIGINRGATTIGVRGRIPCLLMKHWGDSGGDPGAQGRGNVVLAVRADAEEPLIGIGAAVARRPLPHHRAYGSVHGGSIGYVNSPRTMTEVRAI